MFITNLLPLAVLLTIESPMRSEIRNVTLTPSMRDYLIPSCTVADEWFISKALMLDKKDNILRGDWFIKLQMAPKGATEPDRSVWVKQTEITRVPICSDDEDVIVLRLEISREKITVRDKREVTMKQSWSADDYTQIVRDDDGVEISVRVKKTRPVSTSLGMKQEEIPPVSSSTPPTVKPKFTVWREDGALENNVKLILSHTILLISLSTSVTPGPYRRNDTDWTLNRPCSLIEFTSKAACEQTQYRLQCTGGISNQWMKGIQHDILYLRLQDWPGKCFNVGRLQQHFPALRELQLINCTDVQNFKGHFDTNSKIEKIVMRGLTSLYEIPPEVLAQMQVLQELDLRQNVLRHMKARLLKGPPLLERVYLSDNKWDCSDGGLDWLAMERDNGTIKRRIVDYYKLVCHQQLYRGKPLHKVMDIIRTVRHTCPEPCSCAMTHVVSDPQGALIPLITADCAARSLNAPPETLPPSTTTVRLEGNKHMLIIRSVHHRIELKPAS